MTTLDGCLFHDRALELWLNVIAFYLRCVHFPFTAPALQNWAEYAVQEYDFLVTNNLHGALRLSGFDGTMTSFTDVTVDRLKWNENFKLLAARLRDPDLQVLWMDLHALQLIFYKHESPVYLAPVYGTVTQTPGGGMLAYPHIPILPALMALEGPTILDDNDLPDDFTVVPILALQPYQFGFLSHKVLENDHEVLCENIKSYNPYKSTTSAKIVHFGGYHSYGSFRTMSHMISIRKVIALLVPFATCLRH
jgi:hypothetical protein